MYTPAPRRGRGVYCFTSVLPSVQDIFRHIFLSNCWWQKSDIWSQASYRYSILWVAFLDPSDTYFLFADLVGFYTHWTYMHIYCHIFLSNYWWQKSDIWSQASYRYPISWESFLDPSDSYFLFADFVDFYTHWTYMHIFRHIFLSNYWWQRSDIWSQASYRYPISWEAFLDPSDSYFLFADFVDFYTHWTYILYMPIFRHIFLSNYWWQKSDIWSQASYRYPISCEAFFDPSDSYFLFAEERGYHKWALAHSSSCYTFTIYFILRWHLVTFFEYLMSCITLYADLFRFMVFSTSFNNISVISWRSVLLVEETTNLLQVTDKLYHIMSTPRYEWDSNSQH